jgi:hypothetical protein
MAQWRVSDCLATENGAAWGHSPLRDKNETGGVADEFAVHR